MSKSLNSPAKILLADDSVTMHRAVSLGLKKEAFEVLYCDNGQDALRMTREHKPLIVLADLDMPGMTGGELCKAIKEDNELRMETKVILLCGSFDQVDEKEIEAIPADARLWKPFESHVLVSMIHTLLKIPPKQSDEATQQLQRPSSTLPGTPVNVAAEATEDMNREKSSESSLANEPTSLELKPTPSKRPPLPPPPPSPFLKEAADKENEWEPPNFSSDSSPREEKPFSSQVSIEGAKENLWDKDFDLLRDKQEDSPASSSLEEHSLPEAADPTDFEIVGAPFQERSAPQEEAKLSGSPTEAFSGFGSENAPSHSSSATSGIDRNLIQSLVAEEVEKALTGHFKDRLEQKLNDILKQIEKQSKT